MVRISKQSEKRARSPRKHRAPLQKPEHAKMLCLKALKNTQTRSKAILPLKRLFLR